MERLKFTIDIAAPMDKVWNALWDDTNYRDWTGVFCEGSSMTSDWVEGGRALFLDPNNSGMYSKIAKLENGRYVSFEHQGDYVNGEEKPQPDWAGAQENYRLTEIENGTRVNVEVDVTEDHIEHFRKTFPNGLERLKAIAES